MNVHWTDRRWWVSLVLALAIALSWFKPLDTIAVEQAEAGFGRALAAFATARALNAVISVVQGTEVSAGLGLGVTLTPGQVLDPINDLIEQFSTLALWASLAFGAQVLMLKMGAFWGMSLLVTLLAVACMGWLWSGRPCPVHLKGLLAVVLLLRFALPLVNVGSELAFQAFMAERYQISQQGLGDSARALGALQEGRQTGGTEPLGLKPPSPRWWDVPGQLDALKQAGEQAVNHIIHLAVIFCVQTLVLPLVLGGVLLAAGRRLAGLPMKEAAG